MGEAGDFLVLKMHEKSQIIRHRASLDGKGMGENGWLGSPKGLCSGRENRAASAQGAARCTRHWCKRATRKKGLGG